MAAASTQKLHDIVECPICLETLTEPRMFSCFHFYCQKCVYDMKEVKQNQTVGYECPLCRKFTAKGQLQALPIMNQLMEAFKAVKNENQKCGKCEKFAPTQRCLDCKENYCDECRSTHNEFKLFKLHVWEAISDKASSSAKPVIDDVVFCQVHPREQVKLHCRDCKQLICLLCRGTSHHQHTAETIEEALQQILPVVKERQAEVNVNIGSTKTEIVDAKLNIEQSKKKFSEVRQNVTKVYEEIMTKLKEDCAKLCKEIDEHEEEANAKHEARVKQLELQLQSQENVLNLSQSTLDTAMNISLLKALKSGVLDSLNGSLEGADTVPEVDDVLVEFNKNKAAVKNMIGSVKPKRLYVDGTMEISCDELMKKTFTLQTQQDTGEYYYRHDVINSQLWCVSYNTCNIDIYSTEGEKQGTVTSAVFGQARSVIAFKDKALVSATKGLFAVSATKPHDVVEVFDRTFCDVTANDNKVFVLEGNQGNVYVLQPSKTENLYHKCRHFQLENYCSDNFNTIQVTSQHVYIGFFSTNVIRQYTLDGQFVRQHGRPGSRVGELQHPLLSGSDSFNNILIANSHSQRLDVLRADGSFYTLLAVTGICRYPMCAKIYQDKLYVTGLDQSLQVYAIHSIHD